MNLSAILIVLLIVLSAATLISVAIALYLNRWRRLLLANPGMVVQEEAGGRVRDIIDTQAARFDQSVIDSIRGIDKRSDSMEQSIAELTSTFMTLHSALDERDAEIRRLKEGYDCYIFEKFVRRFIRVDRAIEDFLDEKKFDKEGLEQIREILEDALDECGVERFAPNIGENFLHADGVDETPNIVTPETQEDEYKIVEILEPGYRIRGQEGFKVVRASKVRINGPWKGEHQR